VSLVAVAALGAGFAAYLLVARARRDRGSVPL